VDHPAVSFFRGVEEVHEESLSARTKSKMIIIIIISWEEHTGFQRPTSSQKDDG
jgi:hypothetical protein